MDIQRNPRCAVVVDAGTEYTELRGVELFGDVELWGRCRVSGRLTHSSTPSRRSSTANTETETDTTLGFGSDLSASTAGISARLAVPDALGCT
jgi:hypothetical protein